MRNFVIDLNLVKKCNLGCSYCIIPFENPEIADLSKDSIDSLIQLVKNCLSDKDFIKVYDKIQISFFGGEPTLSLNSIQYIKEQLKDENRIKYFIYSNGFKFTNKTYEILKDIQIQISYDGLASHNAARVTKSGKGSALEVKETIYKLKELGYNFEIHPTIAAANFDCLFENYKEFRRMRETGIDCLYSPTIDYLSTYNFTDTELQTIKQILKNEFIKIMPLTKEFYNKNGYYDFGWFNWQKAICTAGDGYIGLDIDGNVLPCHGNFTSSKKSDLSFGRIENLTPEILLQKSAEYRKILNFKPKECETCYTHYCLKCNAAKYEISTREDDFKWVDYTNQPDLCKIFKFIGSFKIAMETQNLLNNP